jgi:hypothetical protein
MCPLKSKTLPGVALVSGFDIAKPSGSRSDHFADVFALATAAVVCAEVARGSIYPQN